MGGCTAEAVPPGRRHAVPCVLHQPLPFLPACLAWAPPPCASSTTTTTATTTINQPFLNKNEQVDFSQSVSHLWKQFRRHGRKGNADMAGEADVHTRAAAGAGAQGVGNACRHLARCPAQPLLQPGSAACLLPRTHTAVPPCPIPPHPIPRHLGPL